jgi:hypothetical protein
MKKRTLMTLGALAVLACAGCSTDAARSGDTGTARTSQAQLDCKLTFSLTGWSLIYKQADGSGVVSCENGQTMPVTISVRGGGLTAGKWHIDNGSGHFTDVHTIEDVLGNYAQGEAHAGVVKSGSAQVLTKGTVSLALAGTGEGIDLGVDVGAFTIKRK